MNTLSINVQGFGDSSKRRWVKELCHSHNINFLALQETKMVRVDMWTLRQTWGNSQFDSASFSSRGRS